MILFMLPFHPDCFEETDNRVEWFGNRFKQPRDQVHFHNLTLINTGTVIVDSDGSV